jgi:exopolyphosphatase/guanosine-5'-triphosphate,3'-diphosphate pyrophosphatase
MMNAYGVTRHIAVATSAMRDAKNRKESVQKVFLETGINIQIISGDFEASLIYESHIAETLDKETTYLYVDVGGGSTELTLISNGKLEFKESFNIGTNSLLKNQVDEKDWEYMKLRIKEVIKSTQKIIAIGTGGNINKIYKITKKENNNISYSKLKGIYEMLNSYTYNERVEVLSLKPDRADVIVHAAKIFITIMKTAEMETIFVPQIGLSDGIVHDLYEKQNK